MAKKLRLETPGVILGETYGDTVHAIEGVATARTVYLTGCPRVSLEYRDHQGGLKEVTLDEPRLGVTVKAPAQRAGKALVVKTPGVTIGKRYRDRVLGIEGVVASRTEFLTGCARVGLEYIDPDGDIQTTHLDETRLDAVLPPEAKKPGGYARSIDKPAIGARP